jgi:hypothetical protein
MKSTLSQDSGLRKQQSMSKVEVVKRAAHADNIIFEKMFLGERCLFLDRREQVPSNIHFKLALRRLCLLFMRRRLWHKPKKQ